MANFYSKELKINNESTEQAAKDIAKAIYEDDETSYKQLMINHKVM